MGLKSKPTAELQSDIRWLAKEAARIKPA
jgi:hypothetical protein